MSKIVVLKNVAQFRRRIERAAGGSEVVITKDKSSAKEHIPGAEVIVGWSSEAKKYVQSDSNTVKWVQNYSAGVDNLPLELFKEKNIILTNAKGVHPRPVSESVFAMMLALARNIPKTLELQKQSRWGAEQFSYENQFEIHGKTIGILGTGAIGEEIARLARAFTMRTLGMRRTKEIAPFFDEIYDNSQMHEMLAQCDYVVNILPFTKSTTDIIDKDAFTAMRDGTRYFAFGRGGTTDTEALIEALRAGKLAGAGIDVVNPEPLLSESPLWNMENVIIQPHIAGLTENYDERVMDIFIENLKSYIETGAPSRNIIDLDQEY